MFVGDAARSTRKPEACQTGSRGSRLRETPGSRRRHVRTPEGVPVLPEWNTLRGAEWPSNRHNQGFRFAQPPAYPLPTVRVNGAYLRPEDCDAFAPKARSVPARGKSARRGATEGRRPGKPTKTAEPLRKSGGRRPESNPSQSHTRFVRKDRMQHSACVLSGREGVSPRVPGRRSPSAPLPRADLPRAVGAKPPAALVVVRDWTGGFSALGKRHLLAGLEPLDVHHAFMAAGYKCQRLQTQENYHESTDETADPLG
jgi:hypothetical protein